MTGEKQVYIVDDEPEMCRSLALLLATDGVPARCFSCADMFLDSLEHLEPGVVVCDVIMPGTSGVELVRALPGRGRDDPVIIIAGHADIALAVEAMKAGAYDFLEKPFEACVILGAVKAAREHSSHRGEPMRLIEQLSPRERQVLELIMAGLTTKEAARRLSISPRTVETYRAKLMEKTQASSAAQLIRLGIEAGLRGPASVANLGGAQI